MFLRALSLMVLLYSLFVATPAAAHQFAPALLELEERSPERIDVTWKQPAVRVMGSKLHPVLPAECTGIGDPVMRTEGTGILASWQIQCPGGLAGRTVAVEGIAASRADVLLRITLADGLERQAVLDADTPSYEVRASAGRVGVFLDYMELGLRHILGGWDHLAFVLGLLLLVGRGSRLLWTITAFTVGHSVTLGLASLGFVALPQAPVEAAIALSIYVLAVELTRRRTDRETLIQRAPWLVATPFGLLHGLGFAGALTGIGLPTAEIPLALFSFNVGIELGQLLFIATLLVVGDVVRRFLLPGIRMPWLRAVPAHVIGGLAVYWLIERLSGVGGL